MVMVWSVKVSCTEVFDYSNYLAYVKAYNGDKIMAHKVVDELFPRMDIDNSGRVDFSEFTASVISRE